MKKIVRGFTFVEVILYLGLFSLLGTAVFSFAWDGLELARKSHTERILGEESRYVVERIKLALRSAPSIDEEASIWNADEGRIVMGVMGTSDVLIIQNENGRISIKEPGQDFVMLHSTDVIGEALTFDRSYFADGRVGYVDVTLRMGTRPGLAQEYTSVVEIQTGVMLRNLGL